MTDRTSKATSTIEEGERELHFLQMAPLICAYSYNRLLRNDIQWYDRRRVIWTRVPNKQMLLSLSCQFKNRRERVDKVVLCIFDWQTVSEKISLYLRGREARTTRQEVLLYMCTFRWMLHPNSQDHLSSARIQANQRGVDIIRL